MKLFLVAALSVISVAFACDCMLSNNQKAFCGSDFVSHIKIVSMKTVEDEEFGQIHYTVEHVDTFKSPSKDALSCDVYTSGSSASCGIDGLEVGKEYLVAGSITADKKLHIHSCGQFQDGVNWSSIPVTLKKQLKAGFKCPKTTPKP